MAKTLHIITAVFTIIESTKASIEGVTFHDDFDFETRYQKPYECDPFYYHPLHLPPRCARMYQKLIQDKLYHKTSIKLLTQLYGDSDIETISSEETHRRVRRQVYVVPPQLSYWGTGPIVLPSDLDEEFELEENAHRQVNKKKPHQTPKTPKTPYDEMIESINLDIKSQPSQGIIKMSNIGPVAVYNQAVSSMSEQLIMELAKSNTPHESDEVPQKECKNKEHKKKKSSKKKKKKHSKSKQKKYVDKTRRAF